MVSLHIQQTSTEDLVTCATDTVRHISGDVAVCDIAFQAWSAHIGVRWNFESILAHCLIGQLDVKARDLLLDCIAESGVAHGTDHRVAVTRGGPLRHPATLFVGVQPAL